MQITITNYGRARAAIICGPKIINNQKILLSSPSNSNN